MALLNLYNREHTDNALRVNTFLDASRFGANLLFKEQRFKGSP
jgi:hypothetical protein